MSKTLETITFSRAGEAVASLPRCSGVYRFYDAEGSLLYIGKSVDIHSRVTQHLNEGRKPGRHQRLMSQVSRIDCQLTAGEIGALLVENAAIKAEVPLFNRRQRRLRRLWTITLQPSEAGFLKPIAIDFAPTGLRETDTFGLFANKHRVTASIQNLARDHALCLRVMGLDKGKGACFQHQLGRCDGACAGEESAASHNARLLEQLDRQRIAAWPFSGPLCWPSERFIPQMANRSSNIIWSINGPGTAVSIHPLRPSSLWHVRRQSLSIAMLTDSSTARSSAVAWHCKMPSRKSHW